MKGIKYIAPVMDFSGYGEASRNYILSLHDKGIPITVHPRNFDLSPPPIADEREREILDSLIGKSIPYDTVIIHLTPDLYPLYIEQGKRNIGFVAWETSSLHPKWSTSMTIIDEMWVPCEWNKEALINSGVDKPIYVIPHGIDPETFSGEKEDDYFISGLGEDTLKFYSIFQWMNRKNPEGLLRAYFNAFKPGEDVALVLKTYLGGNSGKDKQYLREMIVNIKRDMNVGYYPKVILIGDILSKSQILGLHKYCDCYVGMHRGEGWGLPLFEAGLAGNPVIGTNCGGNLEFMDKDNSYLVDCQMTYVSGMSTFNAWYLGNQQWAEPSPVHATELMRNVYENREEARSKGLRLQENIKSNFSWDTVADIMVERLSKV